MPQSNPGFQPVPVFLPNDDEHRRMIAQAVNSILGGKVNATIDVTLTASAATTTLNDSRIGYYSAVIPAMAMTAHAATALAAGIYIDTMKSGSCVVHHNNTADTDKTIRFLIIG